LKRTTRAGRVLFPALLGIVCSALLSGLLGCATVESKPEAVRSGPIPTRIILVQSRDQAIDIIRQIEQGASFAELARQRSIHPTASKYGYLGDLHLWEFNPLYRDAVSPLGPGDHSPIIDTPQGFAILYAVDPRHLQDGLDRFTDKDYAKAAEELESDVRLNPDHAQAYHYLGLAYEELGREDKALAAFQALAKLNPAYPAVQANLGLAYYRAGRHEDAVRAFSEAVIQSPDDAVVMNNLAWCLIKIDRSLDIALKLMRRAAQLEPGEIEYRDTLVEVLLAMGQPGEALAEIDKTIEQFGPSEKLTAKKQRIEEQRAETTAAGPDSEDKTRSRAKAPTSLLPPLPPPQAKVEEQTLPTPTPAQTPEKPQAASPAPAPRKARTPAPAPSKSKGGYMVQLAAFRDPGPANKMRDRYVRLGYKTWVERRNIPGKGLFYRVRLGPFDTLNEAKVKAKELADRYNQKYIIVPLKGKDE